MKNEHMTDAKKLAQLIKKENDALQSDNAHLIKQVDWLSGQLGLLKRSKFGQSSEKSAYDQVDLFNDAETYVQPDAPEPELSKVEAHYRKRQRAMDRLPEDLPVEVVEHVLPAETQICPACQESLHVMGKQVVRRELKLVPAKAAIVEHVQYTYACRNCERTGTSVPVIKAPMPEPVIKGSFASPEAVAAVIRTPSGTFTGTRRKSCMTT